MESSRVSAGPSKHCGLDDSRTREPDLSGGRIWGKKKKAKGIGLFLGKGLRF